MGINYIIHPSIITGTEADGSGIDENKVNDINDIIDTVTDTYKEEEELTVAFELSETENKNLIALFKEEGIVTHIRTLDAINKDTGIAIENIQKFIKKLFRTIECKSFYDNAEYDKYQFRCKTDIFDFEVLDILKIPLGVLYGESTKDSAFYSSTISRVFDGVENNVGNSNMDPNMDPNMGGGKKKYTRRRKNHMKKIKINRKNKTKKMYKLFGGMTEDEAYNYLLSYIVRNLFLRYFLSIYIVTNYMHH